MEAKHGSHWWLIREDKYQLKWTVWNEQQLKSLEPKNKWRSKSVLIVQFDSDLLWNTAAMHVKQSFAF